MTSLLSIAVHFLILTQWLTQQVTSSKCEANSIKLDMAPKAFDDQYVGCTEEMEIKAPQLLKEELAMNRKFKNEWKRAEKEWNNKKNKISDSNKLNNFHGTAVVAYTGNIAMDFNKAVREFCQNPHNFQFKAFHYYLTRALQLLKKRKCYTVYRGCKTKFGYSGKGKVRFGQFTSTSLSKSVADKYVEIGGTLFIIKTCLGVHIQAFSYEDEDEVLIPGYEMYGDVAINDANKTYREISLRNPDNFKSNFNCLYSSTNYSRTLDSICNSSGRTESPASILLLPGLLVLLLLPAEL
ncbi:T-cell ecto-ADP-ribosyltransferase 2-like isoform X1 [Saccopteryx bilineata]|uniref:T-cell ecto-ADP-ribosyltransferase 2-like isoform X1 n=1 Tax=Saccopteryx bilineata TaxID=59482 RepID=UPI00338F0487